MSKCKTCNEMETVTVERNGLRRTMGILQWNHLTNKGKKTSYDGWVQVDPASPVGEYTGAIPSEIATKRTPIEPQTTEEAEALKAMNEAINGRKSNDSGESFSPKPKPKQS